MDKSEEYVEMCREAWKYLRRPIEPDDVVAYRYIFDGCLSRGVAYFFCIMEKWVIKEKNYSEIEPDYIFVVWQQDQLQNMLDKWTLLAKVRGLFDFCEPEFFCPEEPTCEECEKLGLYVRGSFSSMEQFWIAFVMQEKYSRAWKDKKWEKVEE